MKSAFILLLTYRSFTRIEDHKDFAKCHPRNPKNLI